MSHERSLTRDFRQPLPLRIFVELAFGSTTAPEVQIDCIAAEEDPGLLLSESLSARATVNVIVSLMGRCLSVKTGVEARQTAGTAGVLDFRSR